MTKRVGIELPWSLRACYDSAEGGHVEQLNCSGAIRAKPKEESLVCLEVGGSSCTTKDYITKTIVVGVHLVTKDLL